MWGQQGWWAGWSDKIVRGMPICYPYDFDPFPGGQGTGSICVTKPVKRKGRNASLTARRVVVYEDPFASSPLDEPENPYALVPPVKEMSPSCPWLPFPEHLRDLPGGEVDLTQWAGRRSGLRRTCANASSSMVEFACWPPSVGL